jgi:hypothetical protein
MLQAARARVEQFHHSITCSTCTLNTYVQALNQLSPQYIWWWSVAHPELEELWKN